MGGGTWLPGPRDNLTTGSTSLRSGHPGGVSVIKVATPAGIVGNGHRIDSISMSFRYVAGYTPKDPSLLRSPTVRLLVLDQVTQEVLKQLPSTEPLGNYSFDHFVGYSNPISMVSSDLDIPNDSPVEIALQVTNNQRDLHIPLDDLADGFNLKVTWKPSILV